MVENIFVGVLSGIISGFIVSALLWTAARYRRPSVDIVYVATNRATIRNNRCRSIIIGGAWEVDKGNVLYRPDGFRGDIGGFYVRGCSNFEVGTSSFNVGETVTICFRTVKVREFFWRHSELEQKNAVDVSEFAGNPAAYPGWKSLRVKLKGNVQ